ncbi:MAG: hypothetical protein OEM19_05055, partial [Deltaproteobacteria bacterium]|nr:hypothetical protein [Deltaproteobacteria bacterium]
MKDHRAVHRVTKKNNCFDNYFALIFVVFVALALSPALTRGDMLQAKNPAGSGHMGARNSPGALWT